MALPPRPGLIEAGAIKSRTDDLKSVTFRLTPTFGPGVTPLAVVGSFKPKATYFLPALRYRVSSANWDTTLIIGLSSNPAAYGQAASVGTTILDTIINGAGIDAQFVNFYPYGFYLPVDREVFILMGASVPPWDPPGLRYLSAQLYLHETFEQ